MGVDNGATTDGSKSIIAGNANASCSTSWRNVAEKDIGALLYDMFDKMHSSIKSSEQKCINRCTERWWEASQIIQTTLLGKAEEHVGSMDENMIGFDNASLNDSSMKDDWFTNK